MGDRRGGGGFRRRWAAALAAFAAVVSVLVPRHAGATQPLGDAQIESEITHFAAELAKETAGDANPIDARTAGVLIRLKSHVKALVEVDASCPISGQVYNLSPRPLFDVVVTVRESETRGESGGLTSTLHIPYLPAKSMARVSFPCKMSRFTYGYGSRTTYISGDGFADALPLTPAGVDAMVAQRADTEDRGGYSPATVSGSVADQILDALETQVIVRDGDDFRDVAAAFLKTEKGGRALGKFVVGHARGVRVGQLPALLAGASQAGAVGLLDGLTMGRLGVGAALAKPVVDRLCGAAQPERDRGALWLQVLSGKVLASAADARAEVLRRCAGSAAQTSARLKSATDAQLGAALGALEGPPFDAALAAADGPPRRWGAIAELLRATVDAKKLDLFTRKYPFSAMTDPKAVRDLLHAVAGAERGALDAAKAKILTLGLARLAELSPADANALVGELVGLVARGKLPSPAMSAAIRANATVAPLAAKAALAAVVREASTVLSPEWVLARADQGGLDLFAFADLDRERLGACLLGPDALSACLSTLQSAVPGLAREAFAPAFVEQALTVASSQREPEVVARTAKALQAAGVDVKPVVDRLCGAADSSDSASRTSARASSSERERNRERAEAQLAAAASLDANARCVAEVRATMRSRAMTAAGQTALRFLALLVPIALCAVYLRARWAPVRRALADADREIEGARAAGGSDWRVPAGVWSRAASEGLADVTRALEGEASEDSARRRGGPPACPGGGAGGGPQEGALRRQRDHP